MKESIFFKTTEPVIQDTINKISLIAAIITFATLSALSKVIYLPIINSVEIYKPRLVNRDSLNFQRWIAFIDILRHTANFNIRPSNDIVCSLVGFLISFGDQLYVMLNSLIAWNNYWVFVKRNAPTELNIVFILIIWTSFALLVDIFHINKFGRSSKGICNFKDGIDQFEVRALVMHIMLVPGVIYCGTYSFLVLCFFNKTINKIQYLYKDQLYVHEEGKPLPANPIKLLYWKIVLYPMSCFITLFPFLVSMVLSESKISQPEWYIVLFRICLRLPGLTNFIFMLIDPHFQHAIKYFIDILRNKNKVKSNKEEAQFELEYTKHQTKEGHDKEDFLYDKIENKEDWKIHYSNGEALPVEEHIRFC